MRKPVTLEEFVSFRDEHNLKAVSSFTDMDGTSPFGYGIPAVDTNYGLDAGEGYKEMAWIEMRKESTEDEWNIKYLIHG